MRHFRVCFEASLSMRLYLRLGGYCIQTRQDMV
jgi:hypothetical protein